ncbi:enhancer of mRNA-decapping protein 4-like [Quillaja saponaria]|uniref:Enhancer of mRNA-decapping protein 4-like n=1 Tax=Quillaja saponaria TaxID=32244 RepID=A0AAD7KUU7_QUISA|nr:enhancer of mRNA-decapping protein 4-like [Quillaja saponaria]
MASPGNPNQQQQQAGHFDVQKLFKPSTNLNSSPSFPAPSSSPPPPSSYLTPSSSYPPPTGPYTFHPHYLPYQIHHHQQQPSQEHPHVLLHHHQQLPQMHTPQRPIYTSPSPSSPHVPSSPNTNNSSGARLMALLSSQNPPSNLDRPQSSAPFPVSLSPPSPSAAVSELSTPTSPSVMQTTPPATHANMTSPQTTPARLLSRKLPKGRHLMGGHIVYDIDARLPGEVQPQLEVTPITKYASDPGLVLGRQIAVNRSYICYGLKLGAIRVLNINTALRSLLRGHTQRVSDMVFFAEDLHLLASSSIDGRVFIWKINEGPDEEEKPQITGKIITSIQIAVDGESVHPRVCWHPHKQEILMVAIANSILKIDTTKVGKGVTFSAEEPLKCPIDKLIGGVYHIGKHDADVTELTMCQWMKSRLASASTDGTVKIWEDRKSLPLAVIRPYDGRPVNSVTFLTAPHRPDHIVLITAGPLNREVKIWVSASEEGWLLPSDDESWNCIQSLIIRSSSEAKDEDAFFNQVVALPRAGLFLLANAKKNAIYAVHIEYGSNPAETHMDYIAEFTVTMPILSLTGTSDILPDGEHIVQVYCVQTQAIQQYALDLSQCLPPSLDNVEFEKTDPSVSCASDASARLATLGSPTDSLTSEIPVSNATSIPPVLSSSSESASMVRSPSTTLATSEVTSLTEVASTGKETKSNNFPFDNDAENIHTAPRPLPLSPRLSRKFSGSRSSTNNMETSPTVVLSSDQVHVTDLGLDSQKDNKADLPSSDDSLRENDKLVAQNDISVVSNPPATFTHPTHLVTPSEIFSTATLTSENSQISQGMNVVEAKVQDVVVNPDTDNTELEVKVVGETGSNQNKFNCQIESDAIRTEKREKSFYSQASDLGIQMAIDSCVGTCDLEEVHRADDISVTDEPGLPPNIAAEDIRKDVPASVSESETPLIVSQSPAPAVKGKIQKGKGSQVLGPSPSQSPFNSTDSLDNQGRNSGGPSKEAAVPQLLTMQEMLGQLMGMQKEMQKQMNVMVSVPVSKEGRRLEGSLGRSLETVVKANSDALWARFQEENAKQEKLEGECMQQITNLITNFLNKDLQSLLEKTVKKEISSLGPAVARSISQIIEKTISSVVTESFQKGVGEKALNQLEKSVNSKLEATVARQIQVLFQTSGKQALQDALRTSLEASIIPAFEMSCKTMFEQIDSAFQKGLSKHTSAAQQQLESTHTPLVIALRDAINSVSSISKTLSGELADGQRKLITIAAAGANPNSTNPLAPQISNGLHEMVEAPVDPTKELSTLIAERKFEEAFAGALHRSDVSIVSWLCSQVDLQGILSMVPLPLSQGVLLSLLQQLSCDINTQTPRKLVWMREVAAAIDPADPMISGYVRPIFQQVYQVLGQQRNLPHTSHSEASSIRLLMHVINSVLMSCK